MRISDWSSDVCSSDLVEGYQPEGDVVGALVRHPVAEQLPAAGRNDGQPVLRIGLEGGALERVDAVADEHGDGHGGRSCAALVGAPVVPRPVTAVLRPPPKPHPLKDGPRTPTAGPAGPSG